MENEEALSPKRRVNLKPQRRKKREMEAKYWPAVESFEGDEGAIGPMEWWLAEADFLVTGKGKVSSAQASDGFGLREDRVEAGRGCRAGVAAL